MSFKINLFKIKQKKNTQNLITPGELANHLRHNQLLLLKYNRTFKEKFVNFFLLKNIKLSTNYTQRANFICSVLVFVFFVMLVRYSCIAILPTDLRDKLRTQSAKQFEVEIKLAPPRAQIVDRHNRTLALTILQPSYFIIPKRIPDDKKLISEISSKFEIKIDQLELLIKNKKNFYWVKRKLLPKEVEKIGDITDWKDFAGMIEEPKRIYPERDLAAHLIGFVGNDNIGLEGVEAVYNKELVGENLTATVTRDARGRLTLTTPSGVLKPEPSLPPLKLSIDISVQQFAEIALKEGILKAKARGGSATVMDVETGEIIAIASYPTFDLNIPPESNSDKRRFRPLMDALELGSVVKPVFISKALDMGIISKDDKIFCENGKMSIPGGVIHDTHSYGMLTIGEIIKYSSNIGTYKIMQKLGRSEFYKAVIHSGFARTPGTGLFGEWAGRISPPQSWREMRFANMAFGQGIAISPLQLTRAIGMITGGGIDPGISIIAKPIEQKNPGPKLHYISDATSKMVTEMMQSVVEEEGGTGTLAAIPGINIAGKTGTAQKYSSITKSYSERTASFIGVIPSENPKLVISVVIDEPQVRPAYGGTLAGPVFSSIGSQTIRYLNALGLIALEPQTNVH